MSNHVEPIIRPIKTGFAAMGQGWAVHGRTEEDARQKFHEAQLLHDEIDQRPLPVYADELAEVDEATPGRVSGRSCNG